MVKRQNESDHRLIRYPISMPEGADITNSEVLKEFEETLRKINTDICDNALMFLKLDVADILAESGGLAHMSQKLQAILQKRRSTTVRIPHNLASVILSQGPVSALPQ